MSELLLPERQFSKAKSELSEVMDEVVHEHRPQVVQRKGKERMLLVRPDDARRWLDTFRLQLRVVLDPHEVTIAADPLGVAGFGDSVEAALDDLLVEIRAYAHRFFERLQFYAETDARHHAPWLARFALTDVDEQRALLEADMEAEMEAAMTKGKHAVPSAV
jgi:PHD/YefM family antitoxin component YafN of YafNO toxin-antitoxin module